MSSSDIILLADEISQLLNNDKMNEALIKFDELLDKLQLIGDFCLNKWGISLVSRLTGLAEELYNFDLSKYVYAIDNKIKHTDKHHNIEPLEFLNQFFFINLLIEIIYLVN